MREKIKKFLQYLDQINPTILASSITFYILFMLLPVSSFIGSILGWLNLTPFVMYKYRLSQNIISLFTFVMSILWVSSKFANALTISSDIIYQDVEGRRGIKRRIFAFFFMIFFILVVIFQIVCLLFLIYFLKELVGIKEYYFIFWIQIILQFLAISLISGLIYKYVIPIKIKFKRTFLMSAIVTILWYSLTFGFRFIERYFGSTSYENLYGNMASTMLFMLWIYLIVLVYLYGLIFNYYMTKNTRNMHDEIIKTGNTNRGTK